MGKHFAYEQITEANDHSDLVDKASASEDKIRFDLLSVQTKDFKN